MKRLTIILFSFFLISFFIFADFVLAQNKPEINLFYSKYCSVCAKEKEFFKTLKEKYPEVIINEYEIAENSENQQLLAEFYKKYKVPKNEQGWVPITFTPHGYYVGFNDAIAKELEDCLKQCSGQGAVSRETTIKVPLLGEVNLSRLSLPVLTILLGTLDGFNPCAMWVLVVLISLLLSLRSRRKIALVGFVFIFSEGFLYFLIMAAWLNVFLALSYVSFIRILIGLFGIGFGSWRIKDFIQWKPGVCKVVKNGKSQQKIIDKIKDILKPSAVPATILGVIGLAFGVNLIEFLCSAGFPTIYTRILSFQGLNTLQYYLYLLFYNFFYMLDDFIVFGVALFTMTWLNFSDKYNRWSTLIAGVLILVLGILLIFKPEMLMFT